MGVERTAAFVERMTWDQVRSRINDGAVAILPIGAAAKEHGLHLPLNTDAIQARLLAERLAQRVDALIWPTVTYGHYPAFAEYAGSISLSAPIFEATVREIAIGILAHGCGALFVLDTGLSTIAPAGRALGGLDQALHLRVHDGTRYRDATRGLATQSLGSHADELETSLMLAVAPHLVDMARAKASPAEKGAATGLLTPTDRTSPNYCPSGSYGDPTLASREKGEILLAAIMDDIVEQASTFLTACAGEPRDAVRSLSR